MEKRNYGIDMLRAVLMFMVCLLHTLGQGGVLNASPKESVQFSVFWLIEILSYPAVDGFALISGYTAKDRPQKYGRILEMWLQVLFYSLVVTVLFALSGKYTFDLNGLMQAVFPVTNGTYWYFTAYFALFFARPVLDKFLFAADDAAARCTLILIIFLYSVLGVFGDPFGTQGGYSALWLMVLYCVGVLAKRCRLFERWSSFLLILLWGGCILMTWMCKICAGSGCLISYVSPTILLSGLIMVILFSRLQPNPKIIKALSPLTFGIYLFQLNTVIWNSILKNAFAHAAAMNIFAGTLHVFFYALLIFLLGLAAEFVRSRSARLLKIEEHCKKIETVIRKALIKGSFITAFDLRHSEENGETRMQR